MPPLIGWAAARGTLDFHGLLLFAILFAWQFPHFLSIAWIYRDDYQRGGFAMLPSVDPTGIRTGRQILIFTVILIILSLIPSASGLAGMFYLVGAMGLGMAFCWFCFGAARIRSTQSARYVLRASIAYLPLLLMLMVLDKTS
jgi:protoheme IX farnesyltransferase